MEIDDPEEAVVRGAALIASNQVTLRDVLSITTVVSLNNSEKPVVQEAARFASEAVHLRDMQNITTAVETSTEIKIERGTSLPYLEVIDASGRNVSVRDDYVLTMSNTFSFTHTLGSQVYI